MNFPANAMWSVMDFLEKRDFPAAALIDKEWRAAVYAKGRRHNLKPDTILWARQVDYPDASQPASYSTRIVINSNATHVETAQIKNRWVDHWEPTLTRPLSRATQYRILVAANTPDLLDFGSILSAGDAGGLLWPHTGDVQDFVVRIGMDPDDVNEREFPNFAPVDVVPAVQQERAKLITETSRSGVLVIADTHLTCAQIQIAVSCFVYSRPPDVRIAVTLDTLHTTLHALRAIDDAWLTRSLEALWFFSAAVQTNKKSGEIAQRVRTDDPEPRAVSFVLHSICTAFPDERRWPGSFKRVVKHRRTQKLAWYTSFIGAAYHPGGMTAPTTRLPRT